MRGWGLGLAKVNWVIGNRNWNKEDLRTQTLYKGVDRWHQPDVEELVVPDEDVLVGQAAAHAAGHGAALPVLAEHLDPGGVVPHLRQRHARQVAAQRGAAPPQTLVETFILV